MTKTIGVIAEDQSDVDVFEKILEKYLPSNMFKIKSFKGKGCGKIKNKCISWAKDLKDRGCHYLVLLHDLDENNLSDLKNQLDDLIEQSPIKNSIVSIPVKELEAWLLSDSLALKKTFNLNKLPKEILNPERVKDPKKKISDIAKTGKHKSIYLNTLHNKKIATVLRPKLLEKKCSSYADLLTFIKEHFSK